MAKKILGDACAFIPGVAGGKNRYMKIGIAMTDGDRISLKLDTLPIPGAGWKGWVISSRTPTTQVTSPSLRSLDRLILPALALAGCLKMTTFLSRSLP